MRVVTLFLAACAAAVAPATAGAQTIWTRLGLEEFDVKQAIFAAQSEGKLGVSFGSAARTMPAAARNALIADAALYAKR